MLTLLTCKCSSYIAYVPALEPNARAVNTDYSMYTYIYNVTHKRRRGRKRKTNCTNIYRKTG